MGLPRQRPGRGAQPATPLPPRPRSPAATRSSGAAGLPALDGQRDRTRRRNGGPRRSSGKGAMSTARGPERATVGVETQGVHLRGEADFRACVSPVVVGEVSRDESRSQPEDTRPHLRVKCRERRQRLEGRGDGAVGRWGREGSVSGAGKSGARRGPWGLGALGPDHFVN